MKKVALVVAPTMDNAYHSLKDFPAVFIPIGLTSIAAVLEKQGYKVAIFDGDAEGLDFQQTLERVVEFAPDYAGSTCMTATMDITVEFFSGLKKRLPHLLVITGGPHVSALPARTLEEFKDIDFVIKGEGEETIIELMEALEKNRDLSLIRGLAFRKDGRIVETQVRGLIADLSKLPMPAYHLLKYDGYRSYMWNNWVDGHRQPIGVVFTGRGCFGKCNFCATKVIFGERIRYFTAKRIKQEIDLLVEKYKIKILYFQDDTFTANRKLVNELCDYLIEKGYHKKLQINVSARADTIHFPTLLRMKKAGIRWIFFGVESGNQRVLDLIGKNTRIEQIIDAFDKCNRAGMFVGGNFMLGNLSEDRSTVLDTIKLACRLKQDYVSFTIAIPLPGSPLYKHCLDSGVIMPGWSGFGSVNSEPIPVNKGLDAVALKELRNHAVNRFFKRPGYLFRVLVRFHNFAIVRDFITMYFALRKERRQKRY